MVPLDARYRPYAVIGAIKKYLTVPTHFSEALVPRHDS